LLPPEDPVPLRGLAHGRKPPAERADPSGGWNIAGDEDPPVLGGPRTDKAIRVQNGETDTPDGLSMGLQLGVGAAARCRETDDRLGGRLDLEREGELPAKGHEVEPKGTGGPNDEERLFDQAFEFGSPGRGQDPGIAPDGLGLAF